MLVPPFFGMWMKIAPARRQSRSRRSILFTILGFHLAHLIVGMAMLLWIAARAFAGHFSEHKHLAVENSSLYWHFVDLIWVFIVAILYVSPHLYD